MNALGSMNALGVIGFVLLLILFLIVLLIALWWFRRQTDRSHRTFRGTVHQLERDIGVGDRYQTPWVLLLGDKAQNAELLCQAWRLNSEGKAGWFGRWWYGSDGAVLAIPDDMFAHADGALAPVSAWRRLLGALLRIRANRPLDAIVWTVSAKNLWSSDASVAAGLSAYKKFADLQQRLGLSLPVYLVVTETEQVPGFLELSQALPDDAQDMMLGWSSPFASGVAYRSDWVDLALDQVTHTLVEAGAEVGTLAGGMSEALYLLPRQFDAIRGNLQALCDPVFRGNALGEAPALRGIYFVGSRAADTGPVDDFAPQDGKVAAALPVFSGRLLRQRILAEQGLAQPIPRILTMRRRWHRITIAVAAVLAVVWLAGMTWVWHVERNDATTLATLLKTMKDERGEHRAAMTSDDGARQGVSTLWRTLSDAPSWGFSSVLFPTSLFTSTDARIDDALSNALRHSLFMPLRAGLLRSAQSVRAIGADSTREEGDDTDAPEKWPRYVTAKQLADAASTLEHRANQFNHALRDSTVALDEATDLANGLFGLDLHAGKLAQRAHFRRILADADEPMSQPIDLGPVRPAIAEHFSLLMQRWLNRLYADETFSHTAQQAEQELQLLDAGQGNSVPELEAFNGRIDLLRRLVAATNSAWGHTSGQDLVPGYTALLETARRCSLIGGDVVDRVLVHAGQVRVEFHNRWLNGESSFSALLKQGQGGVIELQDEVVKLGAAIHSLLDQSFVVNSPAGEINARQSDSTLKGMDTESVVAAQHLFEDYQKYSIKDVLLVPEQYRAALESAAQANTAKSMWGKLTEHAASEDKEGLDANDEALHFEALSRAVTAVLTAFDELKRRDLVDATTREMNERALASLHHAEDAIQSLALYQPLHGNFIWWDGSKNAGMRAYRATNPKELQQYLGAQLELVANLAVSELPAVTWLAGHRITLSVKDQLLVHRWQNMNGELKRYKEKNPGASPAVLEKLISHDLNDMDLNNCKTLLEQVDVPVSGLGNGEFFAERIQTITGMASSRCNALRTQASANAYMKLTGYFNQYLAGRFPFADNVKAPDAAPERVAEFTKLLDETLPMVQMGLGDLQTAQADAARQFLDELQQGRTWLAPLFMRDAGGPWQGVDVDVRWRTDRDHEQGADQVIEWSMNVAGQKARYPGGDKNRVHWSIGQPVSLVLRWAKDAPQIPTDDAFQPALGVFEKQAGWGYDGHWALLRLLRDHLSPYRVPTGGDYSDVALMFNLPVRTPAVHTDARAQMFLRVALIAPGGKASLALSPLPMAAPPSPFRNITMPDSKDPKFVAASEETL
ncbi:type VI secretion system protein [Andreprevotia chitinilytica]|uniref:type VI secretion system protein n=1 Tax=Andreprevotia chitinilytica TaxID=396808 RepID=UPI0005591F74|nr:type VI secretion protein IcmF/TssM N-terminal domain-containing protein [Andreprevotia chitinilytica]